MEKQIFYHDTDAGGVVYYGRYLNYLEEARTELLIRKGLDLDLFRTQKFLYAVRKCTITYKYPARYGDIVVCDARITNTTAVQIFFDQTITNKKTGQIILEATVSIVSLNKEFKPTPIPEDIKSKLI